jgi:hypothetical protein
MERAHQQIHGDHTAQHGPALQGGAERIGRAAEDAGKQRHDREGRRGREAEPIDAAARRRVARLDADTDGLVRGGEHRDASSQFAQRSSYLS